MTFTRRSAICAGASVTTLAILNSGRTEAAAKGSASPLSVPGAVRWRVGEIDVVAISDGFVELPLSVIPKADKAEEERLRRMAFIQGGNVPVSINTFLIRSGDKLALVDTGGGNKFGPTAGKLLENLRAIGVSPGDISCVLMTHLHSDHVFGLVDETGNPVFPNAEFVVNQREADYWLDDGNLARVPEFQQRYFAVARRTLKPFTALTRRISRDGEEVFPGVTAVALYGHTAGHTGFRVASGNDQVLIWGDVVHMPHVQFAQPAWGIPFDTDGEAAVAIWHR
jgi:glyoxylase-like metal-dependent hydrolase (beta-lactamase superfamily II)